MTTESTTLAASKPKRQKTIPAALKEDLGLDDQQSIVQTTKAKSTKPKSKSKSKPSTTKVDQEENPKQLYGLYSTEYSDYCSGCWFPISYIGPAPTKANETTTDSSTTTTTGTPTTPGANDTILVRWSSQRKKYGAEELNMAFVRSAGEFTRLPVAAMKPQKRVLVRDVLEDMDFTGQSYWLATLVSEPMIAKSKGKKRSLGDIKVEYQNTMWPPTTVPLESIFVLPKVKAQLELIPTVDEPHGPEEEEEEEDEEEEVEDGEEEAHDETMEPAAIDPLLDPSLDSHSSLAFQHSSPKLHSDPLSSSDPFPFSSPNSSSSANFSLEEHKSSSHLESSTFSPRSNRTDSENENEEEPNSNPID